jgi:hypothetical protein
MCSERFLARCRDLSVNVTMCLVREQALPSLFRIPASAQPLCTSFVVVASFVSRLPFSLRPV